MRLQIAFDYLMVFSFVMLVFVLLFSTIAKQRIEFTSEQSFAQLQVIAQVISTEIANAGQAGNGYSATFKLPSELSILAYNVSITKYGSVIVSTDVFGQTVKAVASSGQYNVVSNSTYLQPPGNTYYNIPTYSGTGSITLQNAFGSVCIDYSCPSSVAQPTQISFSSQQTKAISFSGLNSYVSLGNSAVLSPEAGSNGKMTFCMWYLVKSLTNYHGPMLKGESSPSSGNAWEYTLDQNGNSGQGFTVWTSGGGNIAYYSSGSLPSVNKWYFACFTYNYPASSAYYYLNGVQYAATFNSIRGVASAGTGQLVIGAGEGGYSNIDAADIQIYNTPLSSQQISQLYQEGISGAPIPGNSLVGWWPLNGNGKDYSGNYANLAFVGQHSFPSVSQLRAAALNGTGSTISNALIGFSSTIGNFTAGPSSFNFTNSSGVASAYLNQIQSSGTAKVRATVFNGNSSTSANMIAWWPMNLGQGSSIYDISPNSNGPAYLSGNIVDASWASPNYVAGFDGQSGYIQVSDRPSLRVGNPYFTFFAWINPSSISACSLGGENCIIFNKENSYEWALTTGGQLCWAIDNSVPGWAWECTNIYVPVNKWSSLALTYNGADVVAYINGVAANVMSASGPVGNAVCGTCGPNALRIGARNAPNIATNFFNGSMSNVQIYNTPLSQSAIQSLYQQGIGGAPIPGNSLVGWWPLSGNANDYSGNGNNGTELGNLNMIPYTVQPRSTSHILAAYFNGASSSIVSPLATNAVVGTTISSWFYAANTNALGTIVLLGLNGGTNGYGVYEGGSPSPCSPGTLSILESDVRWICTGVSISADTWYYVSLVSSASGSSDVVYNLYLNGADVYTSPPESLPSAPTVSTIIGDDNSPAHFDGYLSNVQIYTAALSSPQEYALYSQGISAFPLAGASLAAWYPLDGNADNYAQPPGNGLPTDIAYYAQSLNAPFITPSISGYGINFNGQNSIITNSNNALLNNQPNFSISGWIYLNNYTNPAIGTGMIYSEGSPGLDLYLSVTSSGQLQLGTWNANTVGNWVEYASPYVIPLHTWTFVTATLSKGGANTGTFTLYTNMKSSSGSGQAESNSAAHYLGIGANIGSQFGNGQPFYGFNGTIADLQVYNTALNQQQVSQLYSAGMPISSSISVPLGGVS